MAEETNRAYRPRNQKAYAFPKRSEQANHKYINNQTPPQPLIFGMLIPRECWRSISVNQFEPASKILLWGDNCEG